jgi:hypothetical protein
MCTFAAAYCLHRGYFSGDTSGDGSGVLPLTERQLDGEATWACALATDGGETHSKRKRYDGPFVRTDAAMELATSRLGFVFPSGIRLVHVADAAAVPTGAPALAAAEAAATQPRPSPRAPGAPPTPSERCSSIAGEPIVAAYVPMEACGRMRAAWVPASTTHSFLQASDERASTAAGVTGHVLTRWHPIHEPERVATLALQLSVYSMQLASRRPEAEAEAEGGEDVFSTPGSDALLDPSVNIENATRSLMRRAWVACEPTSIAIVTPGHSFDAMRALLLSFEMHVDPGAPFTARHAALLMATLNGFVPSPSAPVAAAAVPAAGSDRSLASSSDLGSPKQPLPAEKARFWTARDVRDESCGPCHVFVTLPSGEGGSNGPVQEGDLPPEVQAEARAAGLLVRASAVMGPTVQPRCASTAGSAVIIFGSTGGDAEAAGSPSSLASADGSPAGRGEHSFKVDASPMLLLSPGGSRALRLPWCSPSCASKRPCDACGPSGACGHGESARKLGHAPVLHLPPAAPLGWELPRRAWWCPSCGKVLPGVPSSEAAAACARSAVAGGRLPRSACCIETGSCVACVVGDGMRASRLPALGKWASQRIREGLEVPGVMRDALPSPALLPFELCVPGGPLGALGHVDADPRPLFCRLSPRNILGLITSLLAERNVVLVGRDPRLLPEMWACITALLQPFTLACPAFPLKHRDYPIHLALESPFPTVAGAHPDSVGDADPPSNVLDEGVPVPDVGFDTGDVDADGETYSAGMRMRVAGVGRGSRRASRSASSGQLDGPSALARVLARGAEGRVRWEGEADLCSEALAPLFVGHNGRRIAAFVPGPNYWVRHYGHVLGRAATVGHAAVEGGGAGRAARRTAYARRRFGRSRARRNAQWSGAETGRRGSKAVGLSSPTPVSHPLLYADADEGGLPPSYLGDLSEVEREEGGAAEDEESVGEGYSPLEPPPSVGRANSSTSLAPLPTPPRPATGTAAGYGRQLARAAVATETGASRAAAAAASGGGVLGYLGLSHSPGVGASESKGTATALTSTWQTAGLLTGVAYEYAIGFGVPLPEEEEEEEEAEADEESSGSEGEEGSRDTDADAAADATRARRSARRKRRKADAPRRAAAVMPQATSGASSDTHVILDIDADALSPNFIPRTHLLPVRLSTRLWAAMATDAPLWTWARAGASNPPPLPHFPPGASMVDVYAARALWSRMGASARRRGWSIGGPVDAPAGLIDVSGRLSLQGDGMYRHITAPILRARVPHPAPVADASADTNSEMGAQRRLSRGRGSVRSWLAGTGGVEGSSPRNERRTLRSAAPPALASQPSMRTLDAMHSDEEGEEEEEKDGITPGPLEAGGEEEEAGRDPLDGAPVPLYGPWVHWARTAGEGARTDPILWVSPAEADGEIPSPSPMAVPEPRVHWPRLRRTFLSAWADLFKGYRLYTSLAPRSDALFSTLAEHAVAGADAVRAAELARDTAAQLSPEAKSMASSLDVSMESLVLVQSGGRGGGREVTIVDPVLMAIDGEGTTDRPTALMLAAEGRLPQEGAAWDGSPRGESLDDTLHVSVSAATSPSFHPALPPTTQAALEVEVGLPLPPLPPLPPLSFLLSGDDVDPFFDQWAFLAQEAVAPGGRGGLAGAGGPSSEASLRPSFLVLGGPAWPHAPGVEFGEPLLSHILQSPAQWWQMFTDGRSIARRSELLTVLLQRAAALQASEGGEEAVAPAPDSLVYADPFDRVCFARLQLRALRLRALRSRPYSGTLYKAMFGTLCKGWKERSFELNDGVLAYYKNGATLSALGDAVVRLRKSLACLQVETVGEEEEAMLHTATAAARTVLTLDLARAVEALALARTDSFRGAFYIVPGRTTVRIPTIGAAREEEGDGTWERPSLNSLRALLAARGRPGDASPSGMPRASSFPTRFVFQLYNPALPGFSSNAGMGTAGEGIGVGSEGDSAQLLRMRGDPNGGKQTERSFAGPQEHLMTLCAPSAAARREWIVRIRAFMRSGVGGIAGHAFARAGSGGGGEGVEGGVPLPSLHDAPALPGPPRSLALGIDDLRVLPQLAGALGLPLLDLSRGAGEGEAPPTPSALALAQSYSLALLYGPGSSLDHVAAFEAALGGPPTPGVSVGYTESTLLRALYLNVLPDLSLGALHALGLGPYLTSDRPWLRNAPPAVGPALPMPLQYRHRRTSSDFSAADSGGRTSPPHRSHSRTRGASEFTSDEKASPILAPLPAPPSLFTLPTWVMGHFGNALKPAAQPAGSGRRESFVGGAAAGPWDAPRSSFAARRSRAASNSSGSERHDFTPQSLARGLSRAPSSAHLGFGQGFGLGFGPALQGGPSAGGGGIGSGVTVAGNSELPPEAAARVVMARSLRQQAEARAELVREGSRYRANTRETDA